ncbi:uncharacterized protein LOC108670051 [Hyalella azteca]|uniref:Uncharacterized protein LOC108670051 n=1 Tax=Hyalella azteca TaxID=294128 RepID=A0A8B7NH83_HYAAZ|nr:uncharacterized protein LOC108670051 [Hyalella azteca]
MFVIALAFIIIATSSGQFQFDRFGNPIFRPFGFDEPATEAPDPAATVGNLSCFSCSLDFKTGYDSLHPCLGRHGEAVHPDYLVNCGVRDIFCKVERTEINGVLTTLARSCIDTCYFGCRPRGLGIYVEVCAKCCNTDACNDFYPGIDIGG